jgi:two-component system response regulator FixJ
MLLHADIGAVAYVHPPIVVAGMTTALLADSVTTMTVDDATIHVVDDDAAVRDSMRFLLEAAGLSVRTYDSAHALLATPLPQAGCVLTDLHMPGIDGMQLQLLLAQRGVRLPVIVITGHGDIPLAVRAMKAGAVDFIEKPCSDDALLGAVRRALDRSRRTVEASRRIAVLTRREHEVLELMVAGKTNKQIGKLLGISPRTIDVHRARVFHKLQADSLPELVHIVLAASR